MTANHKIQSGYDTITKEANNQLDIKDYHTQSTTIWGYWQGIILNKEVPVPAIPYIGYRGSLNFLPIPTGDATIQRSLQHKTIRYWYI